jgi:peptidylprolyl isomerase
MDPSNESSSVKRRIPLFLAAISVLALTACSSAPSDESSTTSGVTSAECVDTKSGSATEAVTVTGEVGTAPEVTIDAPVEAKTTQRTIVTKGDGADIEPGDQAKIAVAAYNGTTGEAIAALPYTAEQPVPVPVDDTQFLPGIVRAIECTTVGSRIIAVVAADDSFTAEAATQLGLAEGDRAVFVIDVLDKVAERATGVDQPAQDGLPTVELAEDGQPTVTIPKGDAPTELQIAVLKEGDGAVVQDADSVTVQYQGSLWATGKVFDESWGKTPATFVTNQVVPGFGKALVGQKVGSQVLAVLPPAEGYGAAGNPDAGISGSDTLIFVVDILDTTSPAQG